MIGERTDSLLLNIAFILVGRPMRKILQTLLLCMALSAASSAAENAFSTFNKITYEKVKDILLSSAEKMPEEDYSFRPTSAVRTYGQIIGHLADAQYLMCSVALGEKNPNKSGNQIEKTTSSKTELIAALKNAFAYCDRAYNGMTDASGTEMVNLFGDEIPKQDVLTVNIMHDMEHYGNLVTYMRMKNIVPRTSEPGVAKLFPWE
jgi:uncharacterized damage-inducible protein DinB